MSAAVVTIQANDAQGVSRNVQFLSSDGTVTGLLSPVSQPAILYATPPTPFPTTILAASEYDSGAIPGLGFGRAVLSFQSSQDGALTLRRYVDPAGEIEIAAAAISIPLVPNQLAVIVVNDGVPFGSLTIQATNPGASNATVSNAALLLSN